MNEASFRLAQDRIWVSAGRAGVDMVVLDVHESGGATVLTRFAKGVRGGRHTHPGGEELLVLSGRCALDGRMLGAGDYVATPPGESHELVALDETIVFVRLPLLPVYDA